MNIDQQLPRLFIHSNRPPDSHWSFSDLVVCLCARIPISGDREIKMFAGTLFHYIGRYIESPRRTERRDVVCVWGANRFAIPALSSGVCGGRIFSSWKSQLRFFFFICLKATLGLFFSFLFLFKSRNVVWASLFFTLERIKLSSSVSPANKSNATLQLLFTGGHLLRSFYSWFL